MDKNESWYNSEKYYEDLHRSDGVKYIYYYDTKIGKLGIADDGVAITNVYFMGQVVEEEYELKMTALNKEAAKQLDEYFNGGRQSFELPLSLKGTDFQKKVWMCLQSIPYGETWSYKQVALDIGNENGSRAVGMANNKNPIPVIIPCHRVVGSNGKLVGYAGGLTMKELLLDHERGLVKK